MMIMKMMNNNDNSNDFLMGPDIDIDMSEKDREIIELLDFIFLGEGEEE